MSLALVDPAYLILTWSKWSLWKNQLSTGELAKMQNKWKNLKIWHFTISNFWLNTWLALKHQWQNYYKVTVPFSIQTFQCSAIQELESISVRHQTGCQWSPTDRKAASAIHTCHLSKAVEHLKRLNIGQNGLHHRFLHEAHWRGVIRVNTYRS